MNYMREVMVAEPGPVMPVEAGEIREMTLARAESLMMFGVLSGFDGSPVMDKGKRREKKKQQQEGTRPKSGPGSKAGSKSRPDLVVFDHDSWGGSESSEITVFDSSDVETALDFPLIAAELNEMGAQMKKKEDQKNEHKKKKNRIKTNQKKKLKTQG